VSNETILAFHVLKQHYTVDALSRELIKISQSLLL